MKKIVKEWRGQGIITETVSPFASPVLLVRKKSGEKRLVVDYSWPSFDKCRSLFLPMAIRTIILAIHIDDGLIVSAKAATAEFVIENLKKEFQITTSEIGTYLGMQIEKLKDRSPSRFFSIKKVTPKQSCID